MGRYMLLSPDKPTDRAMSDVNRNRNRGDDVCESTARIDGSFLFYSGVHDLFCLY